MSLLCTLHYHLLYLRSYSKHTWLRAFLRQQTRYDTLESPAIANFSAALPKPAIAVISGATITQGELVSVAVHPPVGRDRFGFQIQNLSSLGQKTSRKPRAPQITRTPDSGCTVALIRPVKV